MYSKVQYVKMAISKQRLTLSKQFKETAELMFAPVCQCILLQIYNTSVLLQRTFSSYLISLHLM